MSKNDDFYRFPTGFLWGSCVCDYQAFGGAECDLPVRWTARHVDHYVEDFELVSKKMHHNAFRTSIEWARLEPKEGKINKEAVKFYHDYFKALRKTGVKTFVTLHHFTNPKWIHEYGGWLSRKILKKFSEYVELVSRELGGYIDYCVVINEADVYAWYCYQTSSPDKGLPPYHNDLGEALSCMKNQADAINEACDILHKNTKAKVGFTNYCSVFVPDDPKNKAHQQSVDLANQIMNYQVPDATKKKVDYMGIDYYSKMIMREDNKVIRSEVYPAGLRELAKSFHKRYALPVAIVEGGYPTRDDHEKTKYMLEHLKELHDAINEDKANVIGYNWWCAVHSYEWGMNFKPFFALIDVEGEEKDVGGYIDLIGSLRRKLTKAGEFYGTICMNNGFSTKDYDKYHALVKQFRQWQEFPT